MLRSISGWLLTFILKPECLLPVTSVQLDNDLPGYCRRRDVSGTRSAGSSIRAAQRASPTGRHHQQRPSQASSVGAPAGRWIEHGTDDIVVPDRTGDLEPSVIYLYIYWCIYSPPACNGWGPWLRLLRGRCSSTHESVPLLGMAGPGPNHRPSRCVSCECRMWREESTSEGRVWRRYNGRRGEGKGALNIPLKH